MVNKLYHCLHIRSPSEKEWNGSRCYFTDRVCSDDRSTLMFVFRELSNIIRIKYSVKISYKMHKQGRHSDKESPHIMLYFSMCSPSLSSSFFAFCNTVLDKCFWNFVSCSQRCVVILNLPEFIIKSRCLLLAVPRDSPNCKKHNEENASHGREHDVRMRSSTRRNLVRKSNSRRKLGRVNFRKDFWDCY